MEKKDTMIKKTCKKQANFGNKSAPVAWVRQEENGVSVSCNVEIVQQQLEQQVYNKWGNLESQQKHMR
jgi:hypothetical protein